MLNNVFAERFSLSILRQINGRRVLIYCFLATSISLIVVIISGQPTREKIFQTRSSNHSATRAISSRKKVRR